MKAWLPVLVDNLKKEPVLALASARNIARAAVFDQNGNFLAGSLGAPSILAQASEESKLMAAGECRLLTELGPLTLEKFSGSDSEQHFWQTAHANQRGAWASWLLTMPQVGPEGLRLVRHWLSTFGPGTTPRLPEGFQDQWSLLALKSGLGRLLIFGDDALALETAALAGRTGLAVTWLTAKDQDGPELDEAMGVGDFELVTLKSWANFDSLKELNLKGGEHFLVSVADEPDLLEVLENVSYATLTLGGDAAEEALPVATTTQEALGIISKIVSGHGGKPF